MCNQDENESKPCTFFCCIGLCVIYMKSSNSFPIHSIFHCSSNPLCSSSSPSLTGPSALNLCLLLSAAQQCTQRNTSKSDKFYRAENSLRGETCVQTWSTGKACKLHNEFLRTPDFHLRGREFFCLAMCANSKVDLGNSGVTSTSVFNSFRQSLRAGTEKKWKIHPVRFYNFLGPDFEKIIHIFNFSFIKGMKNITYHM